MTKVRITAFIQMVSILMFFIAFFVHYTLCAMDLLEAFVVGMIALVAANFVLFGVITLWRLAFSADEWKAIVDQGHAHRAAR
jgi:hypothetical protein